MLLRRRGRAVAATILFAVLAVLGPRTVGDPTEAGGTTRILALTAELPRAVAATVERTPDLAPARDVVPWAVLPALMALAAFAATGADRADRPALIGRARRGTRRDRAPPAT